MYMKQKREYDVKRGAQAVLQRKKEASIFN